jgi:hypothetical protein
VSALHEVEVDAEYLWIRTEYVAAGSQREYFAEASEDAVFTLHIVRRRGDGTERWSA